MLSEKIKTIYIDAKKSENFQTYTLGIELSVDGLSEEEKSALITEGQAFCRHACMQQIMVDRRK